MAFQSGDDEAKQAAATSWKGLAASFLGVGSARLRPDREATQALQDQDLRMVVRNHTGVTKLFINSQVWVHGRHQTLYGY